jgi:hypothetical protein
MAAIAKEGEITVSPVAKSCDSHVMKTEQEISDHDVIKVEGNRIQEDAALVTFQVMIALVA